MNDLRDYYERHSFAIRDVFLSLLLPIGLLVAALLGLLFFVADSTRCSCDVRTEEGGDYKIIEVETHGEKHEYLYFHKMYGRSICHLPNCKYCQEKPFN